MSYDFTLRIPKAQRKAKLKSGPRPEQLQRFKRAREILIAFEPDISFRDDEGMFTAHSAELGDVYVEYDRISLGMSMGAEPRAVYSAVHGLMKRFHAEGYEASDPQVSGDIVYAESFVEFMRQYRSHFNCNNEEFEQWCRGETPTAWAERKAVRERGDAIAATAMPRDWPLTWEQQRDSSDDELWDHLQNVVRRNDAAIAENGLGAYMQALSYAREHEFLLAPRRVDGSCYPGSQVPWYEGSLMHYEAMLLGNLAMRGYAKAVRDQPQLVTVVFDLPPDAAIDNAHFAASSATMRTIYATLKAAGLIVNDVSGSGRGNTMEYHLYGEDADAIHPALVPQLQQADRYAPRHITKRYGQTGAREVHIAWPSEP